MAENTGFFGGLASGMNDAKTQALAQQKQDALEANQAKTQAVSQVDETIKHIQEVIKANADAGNDPQKVVPAIQPLIQSAQGLAKAAGMDPNRVSATVQALLARPALEDADKKPVAVKPGESLVHPTTGNVIYQAPPLDPVTGRPMAQPTLGPSDVIPPGQAQSANPPAAAPTAQVQPSSVPAAPDGTPAQRVAMGFPSQPDQAPAPQGPTLPPTMQPGSPAVDYAISNNIHGPEFLKAIPPTARNTVQGITDYKIDPDKLSKRTDKSGQSEYTRFLGFAHQFTNGEYDPKFYKTMQASLKEFTSGGQTSPAAQIQAANRAIAHAGTVADAIDKLGEVPGLLDRVAKSNTPLVSYAAKQLQNKAIVGTSEGAALREFLTAANHFTDETTKFYAGGQTHEAGKERVLANFDAATSPLELYSALKQESTLMDGAAGALQDRFKNAQAGPRYNNAIIRNAIPDFPILSDHAKSALDRVTQGYMAVKTKGATPASGGAVDYRTYFGNQ